MTQEKKQPAEKVVREIKRKTRRKLSAEEKSGLKRLRLSK